MNCRRDNAVEITDASWAKKYPDFVVNSLQRMGISRAPTSQRAQGRTKVHGWIA